MITQRYGPLEIGFTTRLYCSWDDKGSGGEKDGAFWRPRVEDLSGGWFYLGSMGRPNYTDINGKQGGLVIREASSGSGALKAPTDYQLIWKDQKSGAKRDGSVWRAVVPAGYVALGDLWTNSWNKPTGAKMMCVRQDLVRRGDVGDMIWWDKKTGAATDVSVWSVDAPGYPGGDAEERLLFAPGLLTAHPSHSKPSQTSATWVFDLPPVVEKAEGPVSPAMVSYEEPPRATTSVVDRRVIVPYTTVLDKGRDEAWRVDNSPFYKVERRRFYTLQTYNDNRKGSQPAKQGVEVTTGVSREDSEAYSKKTGMSVTFETGVGVEGIFSAKTSMSLSVELGYERRSSVSQFESITKTQEIIVPGGSAGCLWSRTDEVNALRRDGSAASGAGPLGFNVASYVTGEYPPGSGVRRTTIE